MEESQYLQDCKLVLYKGEYYIINGCLGLALSLSLFF